MSPRARCLPVARPFHDLPPEERLSARRALPLRFLAALDTGPMTILALRLGLGEEEAGALVATLDDLVAAGEIDATGDKFKATPTAQLNAPATSAGTASTASSIGSRLWKPLGFSQLQDMTRVKERTPGASPRAMTSV